MIRQKTINDWAMDIHDNAVDHGWWESKRPFSEVVALCHSELSEALEEDRAGKELFYYGKGGKPEGIATEMIDCLIRILDWCEEAGVNVEDVLIEKHNYNIQRPYKHGKRF